MESSQVGENFDQKAKHSSDAALQRWRKVYEIVKNPKRRFRFTANLSKRYEGAAMRRTNQEKLRIAVLVSQAALQYIHGLRLGYSVPEEVEAAGFGICPDELEKIVLSRDGSKLEFHGSIDGIAAKLRTSTTDGLPVDKELLSRRQQIFGVNKFAESKAKGFWALFWENLQGKAFMMLGVIEIVTLIIGIVTSGWQDGVIDFLKNVGTILLVVFVTATSDYHQSLKYMDLDKEKKKMVIKVTRNGSKQNLSIHDLLPGDIVRLCTGDQVPADGLFVSGFSVPIDQSSLTGETKTVNVNSGNPYMLSGTKVINGSCQMLVTNVGMRTLRSKLMTTLSEEGHDETPLQAKLKGVADIIGNIGLLFSVLTFAVLVQELFHFKWQAGTLWIWSGDDVLVMLKHFAVALTIFVLANPEGLPLFVPLCLAFSTMKMMNDRALVRHLAGLEKIGSATTICCDKTGTITMNRMSVVKSCICMSVKEVDPANKASSLSLEIPQSVEQLVLQSIFTTFVDEVDNRTGKLEIFGNPTESALLEFALSLGGDFLTERQGARLVKLERFNSEKKQMGIVLELPEGGSRAHIKGAPEMVLAACDKIIKSNGQVVLLDEATTDILKATINQFASEGLRTLSLAFMEMESGFSPENPIPCFGFTFIGIFGMKDPIRPGVKESVAACREAGITVRMITGDHIDTASTIARECGILTNDGLVIEGPDFQKKNQDELIKIIPKIQVMARSSHQDKHTFVKKLRTQFHELVALTGDGINDVSALREADIGLAMGIAGTGVAKESADIIILDDNFSTILTAIKWGRSLYVNIQKFLQFELTANMVTLAVNVFSACWAGTTPLTTVQLLWVKFMMDMLGALAFATEPPSYESMKHSPVGKNGNFISNIMWRNILGQALYQLSVISQLQAKGKTLFNLHGPDSDLVLNTLVFNSFVFCQAFNQISCCEMEEINVFKGISKNRVSVMVFGCTVLIQFVIVQLLGAFADTIPLTFSQWFLTVFIGFLGMPIAALLKKIPV